MPNGTTNGWTVEMDQTLRTMHAEKVSYPKIGASLGKTASAVAGRIKRIGLAGPDVILTPEERRRRKRVYYAAHKRPATNSPRAIQRRAVIVAELANVEPGHFSLIDLPANGCRWPYGNGPFTFCGCDALEGKPYCYPHQLQATEPVRGRMAA